MTYTINGIQYWKRNGKFRSWTKEGGRVDITEDEYLIAIGKKVKEITIEVPEEETFIDPKSKVEIVYSEIKDGGRAVNRKKVVTYGNLDKVLANMINHPDKSIKIISTTNI